VCFRSRVQHIYIVVCLYRANCQFALVFARLASGPPASSLYGRKRNKCGQGRLPKILLARTHAL